MLLGEVRELPSASLWLALALFFREPLSLPLSIVFLSLALSLSLSVSVSLCLLDSPVSVMAPLSLSPDPTPVCNMPSIPHNLGSTREPSPTSVDSPLAPGPGVDGEVQEEGRREGLRQAREGPGAKGGQLAEPLLRLAGKTPEAWGACVGLQTLILSGRFQWR